MNKKTTLLTSAALVGMLAAAGATTAADAPYPPLGPLPPVPVPADNPMSDEKVELGKKLFFDGRLSGNGSMPCVACHRPELGWETNGAISFGYPGTTHWRASQTVLNSAYYNKLFWDGAVTSLEAQAKAAAEGAVAGNGDGAMMEMRLAAVPEYVDSFKNVFGTDWPMINDAWKAIAAFERTIVSDPAKVPFDRYMNGDEQAIPASAKRGLDLFEGKAGCVSCHNGPLLSDEKFYKLGVPENAFFADDPIQQITHRWEVYQKGVDEKTYRAADRDHGRYYVTKRPEDDGKWRTPSLREIAYTAPYMHSGALETLDDVIDFYDAGGGEGAPIQPLGLTAGEKADLLAFLKTLSMDEPLIVEDPDLPETKPLPKGN
ncbi:cytochrome-c peroxidase [Caenispirillum salinarum]|uniref:cytochrome-c peroxidase n=1 Tax=Caenispirillum salinarum TaxID=859058 RepID=UPI00384ADEA7